VGTTDNFNTFSWFFLPKCTKLEVHKFIGGKSEGLHAQSATNKISIRIKTGGEF
jgi:hypothetical protein